MKIELWCIGKTNEEYLKVGIQKYLKRIQKYIPFDLRIISDVKTSGKIESQKIMLSEAEQVLKMITQDDYLILLDERGTELSSMAFSKKLNHLLQISNKRIIFLVGGAWGIHPVLKSRANFEISLSKMTFSHQMIRLFFLEQLYRAFSILKNEPYHNE